MNEGQKGVLYLVACAAGAAEQLYDILPIFQRAGWETCVILTPSAVAFVDRERLRALTGYPVRSEYKRPGDPDVLPPADALLVFPATFNTVNKWALGISDNLALGLLCEFTGMRVPILAVPVVRKGKLAEHPAFARSLALLEEYGVHVFYHPEVYAPRNEVPGGVMLGELTRIVEGEQGALSNHPA